MSNRWIEAFPVESGRWIDAAPTVPREVPGWDQDNDDAYIDVTTLLAAFDPKELRDPHTGKWTKGSLVDKIARLGAREKFTHEGHSVRRTADKGVKVRLKSGGTKYYTSDADAADALLSGSHDGKPEHVTPAEPKPKPASLRVPAGYHLEGQDSSGFNVHQDGVKERVGGAVIRGDGTIQWHGAEGTVHTAGSVQEALNGIVKQHKAKLAKSNAMPKENKQLRMLAQKHGLNAANTDLSGDGTHVMTHIQDSSGQTILTFNARNKNRPYAVDDTRIQPGEIDDFLKAAKDHPGQDPTMTLREMRARRVHPGVKVGARVTDGGMRFGTVASTGDQIDESPDARVVVKVRWDGEGSPKRVFADRLHPVHEQKIPKRIPAESVVPEGTPLVSVMPPPKRSEGLLVAKDMPDWLSLHGSRVGKEAAAKVYGNTTHRWSGETFVETSPDWLGLMKWDGGMGLHSKTAPNVIDALDRDVNRPVTDPTALEVWWHEIHHSIGTKPNDRDEAYDYTQKPGHSYEEGFTELGAWITMPDFLEALGIADRPTRIKSEAWTHARTKADFRLMTAENSARKQAQALGLNADQERRAKLLKAADTAGLAQFQLSADDEPYAATMQQAALEFRDAGMLTEASHIEAAIKPLMNADAKKLTMREFYAERVNPDLLLKHNTPTARAYMSYHTEVATAYTWLDNVAKVELARKDKAAGSSTDARFKMVKALSMEVNATGGANKPRAMAVQFLRASGYSPDQMDPQAIAYIANAITAAWVGGNAFAKASEALRILHDKGELA